MAGINPRHVAWIKSTAKEMNARNLPADSAMGKSKSYATPLQMNDGDIEALAFLVLMQASKSAQEDLKAVMAKVKAINNTKEQQRKNLAELQKLQEAVANKGAGDPVGNIPPEFGNELKRADSLKRIAGLQIQGRRNYTLPKTKAALDQLAAQIKNDLDSMSEMGEMQSLRLQMAMDRLSKMMSTLSNLLKKIEKTQDSIVQNLK